MFEAVIPSLNVKEFATALQCLCKIGKELLIEADILNEQLILRTINDTKSVFSAFYFRKSDGYFDSFGCNEIKENTTSLNCKVVLKGVHNVFRTIKNVNFMRIMLEGFADSEILEGSEPNLIIQMECAYGLKKTHRFTYQDCEQMSAIFDTEGKSCISCPPRMLSKILDHLHGTVEVEFEISSNQVTVRSYHQDEEVTNPNLDRQAISDCAILAPHNFSEAGKSNLKTEMSLSCMDFDVFEVKADYCDQEGNLVFSLKALKAFLGFCLQAEATDLALHFSFPGEAVRATAAAGARGGAEAEIVLATVEEDGAGGGSTQPSQRSSAAAPAPAPAPAPAAAAATAPPLPPPLARRERARAPERRAARGGGGSGGGGGGGDRGPPDKQHAAGKAAGKGPPSQGGGGGGGGGAEFRRRGSWADEGRAPSPPLPPPRSSATPSPTLTSSSRRRPPSPASPTQRATAPSPPPPPPPPAGRPVPELRSSPDQSQSTESQPHSLAHSSQAQLDRQTTQIQSPIPSANQTHAPDETQDSLFQSEWQFPAPHAPPRSSTKATPARSTTTSQRTVLETPLEPAGKASAMETPAGSHKSGSVPFTEERQQGQKQKEEMVVPETPYGSDVPNVPCSFQEPDCDSAATFTQTPVPPPSYRQTALSPDGPYVRLADVRDMSVEEFQNNNNTSVDHGSFVSQSLPAFESSRKKHRRAPINSSSAMAPRGGGGPDPSNHGINEDGNSSDATEIDESPQASRINPDDVLTKDRNGDCDIDRKRKINDQY